MGLSISLGGNPDCGGNPYIAELGTETSDCVTITSTRSVDYFKVRRLDQAPMDLEGNTFMRIPKNFGTSQNVLSVSKTSLTILLPFRTRFEVCSDVDDAWVEFRTRDKTYALPDAFTESIVDIAETEHGATVTVQNSGKVTQTETARGATIVNKNRGSNEVLSSQAEEYGYSYQTKTSEVNTSTGVRIISRTGNPSAWKSKY